MKTSERKIALLRAERETIQEEISTLKKQLAKKNSEYSHDWSSTKTNQINKTRGASCNKTKQQ